MGKYKKPKAQHIKDQRSLIKPAVSSLNNTTSEILIEVDGKFHTNTAIQRIINETLEDYKKKLSENKREFLATYIKNTCLTYGIGEASNNEIDDINILNAEFLSRINIKQKNLLTNKQLLLFGLNNFEIFKYRVVRIEYNKNKSGFISFNVYSE